MNTTHNFVPPPAGSTGRVPFVAALASGKWESMFNWLKDRFNLFNLFPDQNEVGGRLRILLWERSRVVRWESSVIFCEISVTLLCDRKSLSRD